MFNILEILETIFLVFAFLFAGVFVARGPLIPSPSLINKIIDVTLYALLVVMGLTIGLTPGIEDKIVSVGKLAVLLAFATVACGIAFILIAEKIASRKASDSGPKKVTEPSHLESMKLTEYFKGPFMMISLVLAGFLIGVMTHIGQDLKLEAVILRMLYAMLFLIGIQLYQSKLNIKQVFLNPKAFIIPICTILGTFVGGAIVGKLNDMNLGQSLSLVSGFGWYTLSGTMITKLGDPILGSLAFLVDIFREVLAIMLIPLMSKLGRSNLAISAAGATSLDVTLPIIEKYCGPKAVPHSITSGAILSLLVPIFIPLFFNL